MLNKIARKIFGSANERFVKKQFKIVEKINALEESFIKLSDEELKAKTDEFRNSFGATYKKINFNKLFQ